MSDYWIGVLSAPALVLAVVAGWVAMKATGWLSERLLVGGALRLTADTSKARRASVASVIYGGRRVWMLAPGDLGFAFIVGLDRDEALDAARRLEPRVSIGDPTPRKRPARKQINESEQP